MVETLAGLEAGTITPQKQDSSLATLCADADSRGWAGGPDAHGSVDLRSLARLPAVAGRLDDGPREEGDAASTGRGGVCETGAIGEHFGWKAIGFSSLQEMAPALR